MNFLIKVCSDIEGKGCVISFKIIEQTKYFNLLLIFELLHSVCQGSVSLKSLCFLLSSVHFDLFGIVSNSSKPVCWFFAFILFPFHFFLSCKGVLRHVERVGKPILHSSGQISILNICILSRQVPN